MFNQKAYTQVSALVSEEWISQKPDASSLLHMGLVIPKLWNSTKERFGKSQP